jgi:hypothetical protein
MRSMVAAALAAAIPVAVGADTMAGCRLGAVPVPGFAVAALRSEEFQALHAEVAPHGQGERWTQIPWQSDLQAARQQAAAERKPLLMWVMDGHPLGCT